MIFLFYIAGMMAVFFTIGAVFNYYPMYALLCLIASFLSISCVFFSLGAFFAGAMEIIVYAGAIMVLFIFSIMMLNTEKITFDIRQEREMMSVVSFYGVILLSIILCTILLYSIIEIKDNFIHIYQLIPPNICQIGFKLFGPYMLMIEMASFILLAALISALHISQECNKHVDYSLNNSQLKEEK